MHLENNVVKVNENNMVNIKLFFVYDIETGISLRELFH